MNMLANMSWTQFLLNWFLVIIALLLILVILIQKGRGSGLSGAFGGGGGASSAFGTKTGDVFTWITVALAALFVIVTVIANFAFDAPTAKDNPASVTAPATGSTESEPATTGETTTEPSASETKPADVGDAAGTAETPEADSEKGDVEADEPVEGDKPAPDGESEPNPAEQDG